MTPARAARAQAAIDFMSSYGFALLIIAVAVYAVMQIGVFNYSASPQYCYADSPFTCTAYAINSVGITEIVLSQSSGGTMNITSIACSTTQNTSRVGPAYGNVNVLPYAQKPNFYPNANLNNGLLLTPGSQAILYTSCYNAFGMASSSLGRTFTGYVWVRYTFSNLPSTYNAVARAVSINAKYT